MQGKRERRIGAGRGAGRDRGEGGRGGEGMGGRGVDVTTLSEGRAQIARIAKLLYWSIIAVIATPGKWKVRNCKLQIALLGIWEIQNCKLQIAPGLPCEQ